jgi:hypothetical protein
MSATLIRTSSRTQPFCRQCLEERDPHELLLLHGFCVDCWDDMERNLTCADGNEWDGED